jgi:hypothetical protein
MENISGGVLTNEKQILGNENELMWDLRLYEWAWIWLRSDMLCSVILTDVSEELLPPSNWGSKQQSSVQSTSVQYKVQLDNRR